MELDKRIIKGKKPLDCLDVDIAKKYIGQKGYFANCIQAFQDLESTDYQLVYATLKEVDSQRIIAFTDDFDGKSSYFLPEEWVEPKKKYRPYTLAEWIDQHEIGEVIHCRNEHKQEFHVMYTGYVIDNSEEDIQDNRTTGRIMLINMGYLLQELFERYEICVNGEWLPFGVIEDD